MNENFTILLLIAGVGLWVLGGKFWRPFRIVVWPIVAGFVLIHAGLPILKGLLIALTMGGTNSLPYGEHTPWSWRLVVFSTYPLASLWIGLHGIWISMPLTVGLLLVMFILSRRFNNFQWKIWEAQAGLLQAMSLIVSR